MATQATLSTVLSVLPEAGQDPIGMFDLEGGAMAQGLTVDETWQAMQELEREGLVRAIPVQVDNGPDRIRWTKTPQKKGGN